MSSVTYEKLAKISLFQDLSEETLSALAGHCRQVHVSAGGIVFHQEDSARTLYLIEQGHIHLVRDYEDGERLILAELGPQDVMGDVSMLSSQPRTATGIAVDEVDLIALDRDIFFEYIGKYPTLAVEVMVQLSRRLRMMTLQLREIAASNAPARLASLILFLAEDGGEIRTGLITTNFRSHRFARAAGVDPEWLQNQLREWSIEGYIGMDNRRLLLHEPEKLIEIAGWV